MDPENNASLAGESAPEPVSLDLDAAASALEQLENPSNEAKLAEAPEPPQDEPAEGSEEPAEEDNASEQEASPDEPSEPGNEDEDDEIVHGNKLVVLRDGEKVRIGELKKLHGLKPELERKQAELSTIQQRVAAEVQKVQSEQAQIAQQAQILQQLGPVVLAKAQAMMPKAPDPEMMDRNSQKYDPIQYQEDAFHYQKAVAEFQQIQRGLQTFTQQKTEEQKRAAEEQHKAQEAEYAQWVQNEHQQLLGEMPELKDPTRSKAFAENIVKGAKAYGYSEDDLKQVKDRRIMKALADLGQFQALRSQKQAVAPKVASAPPVRAPGKRMTSAEQAESSRKSAFERANSGSLDDVAAAIAALKL